LAEWFVRLSPQSRRQRFFCAKSTLTESELDVLTNPDGRDHIALAVFQTDARGRETQCLGAARCMRLKSGGEAAEMAIAVIDEAQRCGIGKMLLEHLNRAARAARIRRFFFTVLAENLAMRSLGESLGAKARWLGDDTFEYDYSLPVPMPANDTCWLSAPSGLVSVALDTWRAAGVRALETGFAGYWAVLDTWLGDTQGATCQQGIG
jgi:GNAT superfamily N-acetyltransferase